jgi:hypothetical protein
MESSVPGKNSVKSLLHLVQRLAFDELPDELDSYQWNIYGFGSFHRKSMNIDMINNGHNFWNMFIYEEKFPQKIKDLLVVPFKYDVFN